MKAFLKWLGRVVGTALCLVLVIVMLPYASRWAAKLIPDFDGRGDDDVRDAEP